jgi:hypothetical protein
MIKNKALFGLLGAGAGTLAVAWYLLPKDSKIKKAITDQVCKLTDSLKESMTSAAEKTVTAASVKSSS